MKNKKLVTYALIVAVIVVWGIVFKRLFFSGGIDENQYYIETSEVTSIEYSSEVDTFDLISSYRDPFLGKTARIKQNATLPRQITPIRRRTKKQKAPEPELEAIKVSWPKLVYKGSISSESKVIAMVEYKGKTEMIQTGGQVAGFEIASISKDSIQLVKGESKKAFFRH